MRNEAQSIERCLASIVNQDYPPDRLEVLIYDGGSTDGSRELALRMTAGRPRWAVMANPRQIQAAAWNEGIRAARGEIVGIVSGHAELASDYVSRAVEAIERTGSDMVGGPVRVTSDGPTAEAIGVAMSTPFGVGGARHHYLRREAEVDTVFMGVSRRDTYLRFPFDEEMVRNQDDELSYRLLDAGGRIVCDPAIRSTYRSRATLRELFRQYHDYGLWKVRVIQKHPRQVRPRHLAPAGLVAILGGSFGMSAFSRASRRVALVVACLYLTALFGATVRYGRGHSIRPMAQLAAAYSTLHAAYGSGLLRGLWRFRAGWRRISPSANPRP